MPSYREEQEKLAIAKAAKAFGQGRLSRREFFRICAGAGLGFSTVGMLAACGQRPATQAPAPTAAQVAATAGPASAGTASTDAQKFLQDVGGTFRGTTIRVVSESTPPSRAISEIMKQEFEPLTGMTIEWEQLPLDQVLAKVSQDTAGGLGSNDLYYFDQAWLGRFVNDTLDPRELIQSKPNLNYPNYNIDDFLKPLMDYIGSYKGRLVGLPYDIPIFIMMYRKDIMDQLKLQVPTTMDEYLNVVKAIHEAKIPVTGGQGTVAGTVGQWKSGHYALQCDMTAWLWAFGGAHYDNTGKAIINNADSINGLNYMMELGKYMPSGATTWDWSGQGDAFTQGLAGIMISWGEFFPGFDVPDKSKVVGVVEPAACPKETKLRAQAECGFDEKPGISHQGGSCLALSKYSKNADAAWVFMQWATSSDVQTRASIVGGGATPMRKSTFDDPRTKEMNKVVAGTTRHFDVTLDAIMNRMGSEPHLPPWAALSVDVTATELGKMTTGQQSVQDTANKMAEGLDKGAQEYLSKGGTA
ncbi:MAG: extracellular solute-binding protein [Chloroflexaceae bacterium]|jgi:multiple sugar transport system substrate-binding protein|nr:extracellular solute-binding protein [Chloroflexaceae bacterium]